MAALDKPPDRPTKSFTEKPFVFGAGLAQRVTTPPAGEANVSLAATPKARNASNMFGARPLAIVI